MHFFKTLPRSRYRWLFPVPASCLLQAFFGLLYANGVFIAIIDRPMFTLAIGLVGFFISIGIALSGILMHRFIPKRHYQSAPTYIALLGSLSLLSQIVMAYAVHINSTSLLFTFAIILGTGSGSLYVASIDVLQSWVPESPGLITSAGMVCNGTGTLFGIYIYSKLAEVMNGALPAMTTVAALSATLSLIASLFTHRPPQKWSPFPEVMPLLTNDFALQSHKTHTVYPALSVLDILTDRSFWHLVLALAATTGPGFGFVLAFQKMCTGMFGISNDEAGRLLAWATFSGILGRIIAGACVDFLQSSDSSHGLEGSRTTIILLLLLQLTALSCIPVSIRLQNIFLFTLSTGLVYIVFCGGSVAGACLARGMFMPNNASLAFSLTGISIGMGDLFFSWIVAMGIEKAHWQTELWGTASNFHYNDFNAFWICGVVWTSVGLLATLVIKRSEKVHVEIKDDDSPTVLCYIKQ